MKAKICATAMWGLLIVAGAACGFKSDLYLPEQTQKPEQGVDESLNQAGDEKRRQLENQSDDSALPVNGEVVELPTTDELARDQLEIQRKKATENSTQ